MNWPNRIEFVWPNRIIKIFVLQISNMIAMSWILWLPIKICYCPLVMFRSFSHTNKQYNTTPTDRHRCNEIIIFVCFWKHHVIIWYWLLIDNHHLLWPYVTFFYFIGHKTCYKKFHTHKHVLKNIDTLTFMCNMCFYYSLISNINKCVTCDSAF